jgi:hypothetical protein
MNTIKQQIRNALLAALNELKTAGAARTVERHRDVLATAHVRPALLLIEGGEVEKSRDATGQTYEFDVFVKVLVDRTPDSDTLKDELVAKVQQKLENLGALSGLATYSAGGEEKLALTARFVYIDGPFVRFRLCYKRKAGDPEQTY